MDNIKKTIADTFLDLAAGLETGHLGGSAKIALMGIGSEHGEENTMRAAEAAARQGVKVVFIGTTEAKEGSGVETVHAEDQDQAFQIMEDLLHAGKVDGAVAMHYPFPIGVATVGRSLAPATAKEFFLATTTGTSSTDRTEGMILNAIAGLAVAKTCGVEDPTVGILNLDASRQVEIALKRLQKQGYNFTWAESARSDGGAIMRGNDVLLGTPDVMVNDTLTGNVITKMLSAGMSGGRYETVGFGYGPGVGPDYKQIVLIVSRASGAPLITNAIKYAAELAEGDLIAKVEAEFAAAHKAGLQEILDELKAKNKPAADDAEEVAAPPKEVVTGQIFGVDVLDLEDAVKALWKAKIYAESGMGCTGPVVRVPEAKEEECKQLLIQAGYISE